MSKTITVFFRPGQRSVKTDPLFQWDDGVILKFSGLNLPDTYVVDFSNSTSGGAKKRNSGNSDGVLVPAEVFTSGTEIYAWPVWTDEIGSHTEAVAIIPIDRRARPAGALPPGPQDDDARTIITDAVNAWMDAHAGEIGGGISEAIKNALLQLAEHVAYIDEHGQDYYDDLEAALNYVKELTAISAQFSQGGATIYDNDTLDTLRRYLAVVAQYNDSTSELVTDYTLSGVLEAGTSTITAAYEGETDSFDVTVTHYEAELLSISADFEQGSATIYDTDDLDDLKQYLTVTATYEGGVTAVVPAANYTLSGSLTEGTSTITVSYGGKTTTFSVTVTHYRVPGYALYIPATNTGTLTTSLGRDATNKISRIVLDCALPVYSSLTVLIKDGSKWAGVNNGAWDGSLKTSATPAYSEVAGNGRSTISFEVSASGTSYLSFRTWSNNHPEMTLYGFDVYSGDTLQGSFKPTSTVGEMYDSISDSTISWSDTTGMTVTEV